jgi:hypothetical protein
LIGSSDTDGNQPKEEAKHVNIPTQNEVSLVELILLLKNGEK